MNITKRILTFLGFFILPLSCFADEDVTYLMPVEVIVISFIFFFPIIISIISMIIAHFCKKEKLLEILLSIIGGILILSLLFFNTQGLVVLIPNTLVSIIAMIFINFKASLYKKISVKIFDVIIILGICFAWFKYIFLQIL